MDSRLLNILLDSFPKILLPGLTMTLPLTAIAFSIAMVIAVAAALAQGGAHGLGQDDPPHGLQIAQPRAQPRLQLSRGHRLQGGPTSRRSWWARPWWPSSTCPPGR